MSARAITEGDIVEPGAADSDQLASLARVLEALPTGTEPKLVGPDDAAISLTPSLVLVLKLALTALRAGHAVAISSLERMLTTTEAGELLGISRQYLTRLIESGDIPCGFTGRHRRIKLADVLSYQHDRAARRAALLEQMTAEAAAAGEYD